ncbi:hypothetical protein BHE74_00039425 [Ensete ventricosum]|nr:hypothetical protein BHE74_00039425 [Ensete ventricosum]
MDSSSRISKIRSRERERLRGPSWLKVCWFFVKIRVAKDGIPLPQDRTLCPLCSQKRMNPSVVAVSGFVFCYSCIFKYVSQVRPRIYLSFDVSCDTTAFLQYKRCPITLMPATVEHIRRLFHDL